MISSEDHPRMKRAHKLLLQRLGSVLGDGTRALTTGLIHELTEVVKHHRAECRREHDLDFPALVLLAVPTKGIVSFVRADLDIASIKQSIVNFARMNPHVTPEETVAAFRAAFPDLKPGDVMENRDTAEKAADRALERAERIGAEATAIIENTEEHEKLSWEKDN